LIELFTNLKANLRPMDFVDIGIVAFLVYRVLLLIKGTRAMQMLTGLGILGIAFFLASRFGLFTTHWVLAHFFDYLILIVIVLFQDDLRRALTNVGRNPFMPGSAYHEEEQEMVEEISRAASNASKERVGALIVIERETALKNFIETGSQIEAKVRAELLVSIFHRDSPIHDGAVIITGGRIAAAACFLPLSKDPDIDRRYGSRHRAAFGITEESDAIVVVVSEETGEIHLVKNGKITTNLNELELKQSLEALLDLSASSRQVPKRMRGWIQAIKNRGRRSTDR
jgi:diadenylate cyclase